ncbi:MAG: hypothetical protein R3290_05885, partial [Acidimicrobiia bacterium]|nr:hypothetical protein [Acidimicrobiia bacterium]
MKRRRWLTIAALVTVFALVAAACGDDDDAGTTTAAPTTSEATTTTAAETTTTAADTTTTTAAATTTTAAGPGVNFDVGVTAEPCPDSPNPDNGCIYLGVISDLSDGPFAAVAVPLTQAQEDFWGVVNDNGGLNGFDVAITSDNTIDAHYVPDETVAGYEQIRNDVVALAQILGTPQSQAALPLLAEDQTVAAPATWWSGWSFPEFDQGLILEAGSSYCFEGMNSMTFAAQNFVGDATGFTSPADIPWAIVAFPGDYGGDWAAGAKIAAAELGFGAPLEILQIPFSVGGTA